MIRARRAPRRGPGPPVDPSASGLERAHLPLAFAIETERLVLRPFRASDVRALRAFAIENETHLAAWSPRPRTPSLARSIVEIAKRIAAQRKAWRDDRAYAFAVTLRAPSAQGPAGALVGRVSLNDVIRGAFQNAHLGYLIGHAFQGHGLAREAVAAVIAFAFDGAGLHRVQAAIMPHNPRSLALARALRLREEGLAQRYLMIDGAWRDHVLFAVTREDWGDRASDPAESSSANLG
jgi:ribosomal-protein-alanine N-acetyltransferase